MRLRFGISLGLAILSGFGCLMFGLLTPILYLKIVGVMLGAVILLPGLLVVFWLFQVSRKLFSEPGPTSLQMETWVVADDGQHNAFTDMLFWHGQYWLVYVSSPSHFASNKSRLVLSRSSDAHHWQEVRKFDGAGQDIRDPKLGIVNDQLFLYALLNQKFDPEPYKTIVTSSPNGLDWAAIQAITPDGWLLGRPATLDGTTWYAPAHRTDEGSAVLLRSVDGVNWVIHSTIYTGNVERADETALHFLKKGGFLAVTRLEAGSSVFGSEQAVTLISIALPPYTTWVETARSPITRLDGPVLFSVHDRIYAVGRRQPYYFSQLHPETSSGLARRFGLVPEMWRKQGSVFEQKRTALFLVDKNGSGLTYLADLPSSGDTSYAGVVVKDEKVFISYYSNEPSKDYPWILGMLLPTRIQITMFDFISLKIPEDKK